MSKRTRLCPYRKVVERESNSMTGKTVERERFQPCIGHKCMAYMYTLPYMGRDTMSNPNSWGCARLLKGGADNGP